MNDPADFGECTSEQRIEAVKRWVEYIESESPETWGPGQNAIVSIPLESTQRAVSSATQQHGASGGTDFVDGDGPDDV